MNISLVELPLAKLTHAIHFAAVAHRKQTRKNAAKTPYINHPIEVMALLAEIGVTDIDVLCAAVLHDTVEDQPVTRAQLVEEFGEEVASIVMECTDDKSEPKVLRKQHQIEHARVVSRGAKLIKCADKCSNLRSTLTDPPATWSKDYADGYFVWAYAVWLNARDACIGSALDAELAAMFEARGLTAAALTQEQLAARLDSYYDIIRGGEHTDD
jgi:guanosine-3',5'-bis(diphosphate) 3'-pyrophosphohydrolase